MQRAIVSAVGVLVLGFVPALPAGTLPIQSAFTTNRIQSRCRAVPLGTLYLDGVHQHPFCSIRDKRMDTAGFCGRTS
jgi:hypothetical protein